MKKLYEKNEVLFALLWIMVYCGVMLPIKGNFGTESPWSMLALFLFALGIFVFIKGNHLEEVYGLDHWPKDTQCH